jgi:hypothetical protein
MAFASVCGSGRLSEDMPIVSKQIDEFRAFPPLPKKQRLGKDGAPRLFEMN